jgi:hypothetical protein
MKVTATKEILSTIENVWSIVTDFENSSSRIKAIKKTTVLNRPTSGFIGLKWQETRVMFGKEATETMWISDCRLHEWFESKALNSGCEYTTRFALSKTENGVLLEMSFKAKPLTFAAHLFAPLSFLFSGMIKKAFESDLADLKFAIESKSPNSL